MQHIKDRILKNFDFEIDSKTYINIFDCIMSFILTKSVIFLTPLPVGLTYALATYKVRGHILGIIGGFIGYLFHANTQVGFSHAGVLIITVALMNLLKISDMLLLLITFVASSLITLIENSGELSVLVGLICVNIVCISSYYIFIKLLQGEEKFKETAFLFLMATVITSTASFSLFNISFIRIFCVFTILLATYYLGVSKSAVLSVLCGSCLDISLGTSIFTIGYSFASIVASTSAFLNKTLFSIIFMVMYGLFSGFSGTEYIFLSGLYEVFIATILFSVIPEKNFEFFKEYFEVKKGEVGLSRYNTTTILNDLSDMLVSGDHTKSGLGFEDLSHILNKVEDKVCRNCILCENCLSLNYESTIDAKNTASVNIVDRGYATHEDFPKYFSTRCLNFSDFLHETNQGISSLRTKVKEKNELFEQRKSISEQYKALSNMLKEVEVPVVNEHYGHFEREIYTFIKEFSIFSKITVYTNLNGLFFVEIRANACYNISQMMDKIVLKVSEVIGRELCVQSEKISSGVTCFILKEEPKFKVFVDRYTSSKEEKCGDCCCQFTNENDIFYNVIADGMGSGEIANKESENLVSILIKLLKSNVSSLKATKVIEPLAKIKAYDTGFVALDVLSINKVTLEATFVKYGAFSSYILRDNELLKVPCKNLALGLDSPAEITTVRLKLYDKIIMMSDGINLSEKQLENIMYLGKNQIIQEIFRQDTNENDDKTAVLINIEE